MITREVREWLQKVERCQYSQDDAMQEFMRFSAFLTREEMKMIKSKIEQSYGKQVLGLCQKQKINLMNYQTFLGA